MDFISKFSSLWNRTPDVPLPSSQRIGHPTSSSATFQTAIQSPLKGNTSLLHIRRQHYLRHLSLSTYFGRDTLRISGFLSCPSNKVPLDNGGEHAKDCSVLDLYRNPILFKKPSNSSLNDNNSFSIPGPDTSDLTTATSVSLHSSFTLGWADLRRDRFPGSSMQEGDSDITDQDATTAVRKCSTCGTYTSITPTLHFNDADTQPPQPGNLQPVDGQEVIMHDNEQGSEQDTSPARPNNKSPASRTSHTSDSATTSRTITDRNEEDTALDRHQWDVIEQITNESLKKLLRDVINEKPTRNVNLDDCDVESRFRGGYNHVAIMSALVNKRVKKYVVRIPAIGTKARWREGDAHNMRCEVSLTKYLQDERIIPVPKIIAFDDKLDTVIGAPYILMKKMRGRPAQMIWYDEPGNRTYETTSNVTPETEVKRCTFLRSLAFQMSKLECLRFDKIGIPDFTDTLLTDAKPKVACAYRWKSAYDMTPEDLESDGQIYKYGPFVSSQQYMTANIDTKWPNTHHSDFDEYPDTENMIFGVRKILDMLYSHPLIATSTIDPLDSKGPESFVLGHPDLDFQNILCDDQGNVTGIIDWEGCMAIPRCAGFSAVPDFLRRYWVVDYETKEMPHMDWQVDRYVKIYTDAMREFSPIGAVYTRKSAMYNAVVRAVGEGNAMDVVQKLFKCIPAMRGVDAEHFEQLIGMGCPAAEASIKEEIERLLAHDKSA